MFRVLKAKLLLCIVKKCYFCSQYQYTVKEYQDLANQPTEFYYDPNGNLIADLDRNIVSIRYNVLNLPDTIQFSNGNQITNRYTADGIKRMSTYHTALITVAIPLGSVCQWYRYSRHVYQSNGTIYCGNAEYEIIPTGGASLQRIDFGNGYIRNNTYYYTITDYLGNISSVWNGTSNLVEQQTTYYPSGLPHRTSTNANLQRYKYNGKELITNHGYDQYDYHARGYYPAIMRFTSVDPLAEKKPWLNGYHYCSNNPVNRIDPNGLTDFTLNKKTGEVKQVGEKNDDPDRILKTNRKGEVKYNKNGEAKVGIDNISKGILEDGLNLQENDVTFKVNGDGQPTLEEFNKFIIELSDYVGKEISGVQLGREKNTGNVDKVLTYRYEDNLKDKSITPKSWYTRYGDYLKAHFHTHPYGDPTPSREDLDSKIENPKIKYIILTRGYEKGKEY